MASFVFLCDSKTEQECLDRSLFGTNPGSRHQHHYSKISIGDTLFLYNLETGVMRGPYIASTTCKMNIEPAAWRKSRRSFPWQVRVTGPATGRLGVDELQKHVTLAITSVGLLPPAELSDEQAARLLEIMQKSG